MQFALNEEGTRVEAERGVVARCPGCAAVLLAKATQSVLVAPHWAHRAGDCDTWYEPESAWHRGWKEVFPVEQREVVMDNHRADVRMRSGTVLEIQHSPITTQEIVERESFYGDMIWLLDARKWDIGHRSRDYQGSDDYGQETYDRFTISFTKLHEQRLADGALVKFRWRHPKRSWSVAKKPLLFDIGGGRLIQIGKVHWDSPAVGGWGHIIVVDTTREARVRLIKFAAEAREAAAKEKERQARWLAVEAAQEKERQARWRKAVAEAEAEAMVPAFQIKRAVDTDLAAPVYRSDALVVRIPESAGKDALERVIGVIREHPGARRVRVVLVRESGVEAEVRFANAYVTPGLAFKQKIDTALGRTQRAIAAYQSNCR